MIIISEVNSQSRLEDWIKENVQSRDICAWLSYRSVMRLLPASWKVRTSLYENYNSGWISIMPSLRCSLVISYAVAGKVLETEKAEYTRKLNSAASWTASYARIANSGTAELIALTAGILNRHNTNYWKSTAKSAGNFSNDLDQWKSIRFDCSWINERVFDYYQPLWVNTPSKILELWENLKLDHGEQWNFWTVWYENLLNGYEQNWPLVRAIVFQPDEFWNGSDGDINARINEIAARYEAEEAAKADEDALRETAKANSPNAEFVHVVDGHFITEPIIEIDKNFYEQAVERAVDAMTEMRGAQFDDNLKGLFDTELDRLTEYLGRLSDKPLRIYEELMRIVLTVDEKIKYNGLDDWRVNDFRTKLDNSALDILTHDDQVRRAVRARAAARFDRMTAQEQEHYKALMEYLAVHSEPGLAEEMRADAATATDPEASEEDQHEARYQSGSRATRMTELRDQVVENAEAAEKIAKSGKTVAQLGREIMGWFL